jgi:hypothetical protein
VSREVVSDLFFFFSFLLLLPNNTEEEESTDAIQANRAQTTKVKGDIR